MKFYRGAAAAARAYVEADHSRADDYYLAEGEGVAERFVADTAVASAGFMDGDAYERWAGGYEVDTGLAKGRISKHERALRFVEVVVNGPKTWSIAAALHPEISTAYDAAQRRAASEIVGWLAEHSTTRVGPRGRQVQVPVGKIEAAAIRHYTSRAGDPHRHLHLQINAKVFAAGTWRALHSVGTRDSIEAINGIGHAAVMCDPEFRQALASLGYSVDETGEIEQLAPYVGRFSQRTRQITQNLDTYEAAWRRSHPDQEPGPQLRRSWDRRAWNDGRDRKGAPKDGAAIVAAWNDELHEVGFRAPSAPMAVSHTPIGALDRDAAVQLLITRLGAKRSAWNAADIRGEAEKLVASQGVIAERSTRAELAEDLCARVIAVCQRLLDRDDVPQHVRSLTSQHVLDVEADLVASLISRAAQPIEPARRVRDIEHLDPAQQEVVAALAGDAALLVIEGAAGTGKTTTLAAAASAIEARDRRLVVVTPTLKAAQVVEQQIGATAFTAAKLAYEHGYAWDEDGRWSHAEKARQEIDAAARLLPGDVLLVDEAGMLDQDTAHALCAIADRAGATLALLGDRHQLPAVGRGGVLDLAARWVRPEGHLELESVHRFSDPVYAELSLLMRTGERTGEVFDSLVARGSITLHATEVERTAALAEIGVDELVVADTREQVGTLNAAIRDARTHGGERDGEPVTRHGERIGLGDRVATRRNDRDLGVANRDTWIVAGIGDDGSLLVFGRAGHRELPRSYVAEHVELAYATTVYGAQGDTVDAAHLVIGETTGAAAAYVAMTRGRHANTAHLVAESLDDARRQWVEVFSRDRADLGPARAAERAADDIERYGPRAPRRSAALQAALLATGGRRPPDPVPAPRDRARLGMGR
ncbi:MAG: MobF family relaxase [Nocardioides sp.]